jgi:cell division protein FtsB
MTNMENNYIKKLTAVKVQLTASLETQNAELEKLEKEFADLKLNQIGRAHV